MTPPVGCCKLIKEFEAQSSKLGRSSNLHSSRQQPNLRRLIQQRLGVRNLSSSTATPSSVWIGPISYTTSCNMSSFPSYKYIISKGMDPVFAVAVGVGAGVLRIRREEKDEGKTMPATWEALKR